MGIFRIIRAIRQDADHRKQLIDCKKRIHELETTITQLEADVSFWKKNSALWEQAAQGWRELASARNNQQPRVLRIFSGGRPAEPEKPPFADR